MAGSDIPAYAELHCVSDFSFLRGAASARQLFERAKACGYSALAITDECSLAGIVRAFEASNATGVPLIIGSEFQLDDGPRFVLLVENQTGYERLCALISIGRRAATKGSYSLSRADVESWLRADENLPPSTQESASEAASHTCHAAFAAPPDTRHHTGLLALWLPGRAPDIRHGQWLRQNFSNAWLAVELHRDRDDDLTLKQLLHLAEQTGLPAVATGDVHMDVRRRRPLQDVLTALRHNVPVAEAGLLLFQNGERHLRQRETLANIYPASLLAESVRIAERCHFRLNQIRYRYPAELVPDGETPSSWLRQLTEAGMRWRWPQDTPPRVARQIDDELTLIADLNYEAYFLTVHDIVRFARSRNILCQGRGSAANSAVCFALGITEVDPSRMQLLMERFISRERNEPPDIDVDFEHERREEVFQYIYGKYGRARAALTANVICYRSRSAARDVARALGFPLDQVNAISACFGRSSVYGDTVERLREAGFDPDTRLMQRLLHLVDALRDHPRHLSQHVGGFVISDEPLSRLVPIENAAMPDRTIIQWNKDDLDVLGLLKVDCLALGMLTCIRKALSLLKQHHGLELTPATIPQDDAPTWAMIQQADTIGTFQIESRAQMSMLPRLKPASFYDLVIQVAIVRPGPIQGKMVHPYLRRRQGKEAVTYPSAALQEVFERTLGVPLFQEQVMKLAVVAAGYTPGEADQLRRSMAAWRRHGDLEVHRKRLISGMLERDYTREFAERIFEQLKGFASYGFPESHSASFALITWTSCWLKQHYPAAFVCALLNSQPMGFYSASSLIQDARRHGVRVLPVDVLHSHWDNTLESIGQPDAQNRSGAHDAVPTSGATAGTVSPAGPVASSPCEAAGTPTETSLSAMTDTHDAPGTNASPHTTARLALRLGFRQLFGCSPDSARRIVQARERKTFGSVAELCERARLNRREATLLSEGGALRSLSEHRNAARWEVAGVQPSTPLLHGAPTEQLVTLPAPHRVEELMADYRTQGLTLETHPVALLRTRLDEYRCLSSSVLKKRAHGSLVRTAGLVIGRQRPGTAHGTTFVTLEDEDGVINVVVWQDLAQRQRQALVGSRLLAVDGRWEHVDGVCHLIARQLHDLSNWLGQLVTQSRDFH
ncbi:MAG: error-prone DNA polymerase [Lautropia sp.]|nr:error-prone DNA polymerase [Lautropia sp.]